MSSKPDLPYLALNLVGHMDSRVVCLALPAQAAQALLPDGLSLDEQHLTPPGTHPLSLHFCDISRAHLAVPSVVPSLTYNELIVSVPFVRSATRPRREREPWSYLPRLLLNDAVAIGGGILFYGFPKVPTAWRKTDGARRILDLRGQPLLALEYEAQSEPRPAAELEGFGPTRSTLDQPIYTQLPAGVGALRGCTHFERKWSEATARPLRATLTIDQAFLPGLPVGRFGEGGAPFPPGLGAFEVAARFRQSLPYPELLAT